MSITLDALLGKKQLRVKPLLFVTVACVVALSILGVPFGAISVFAALPFLSYTPLMLISSRDRLGGDWDAEKLAAAREVMRTGKPMVDGPYAGLWFDYTKGQIIFSDETTKHLTLPITTRPPASAAAQRTLNLILAHGALVAMPAFALMLACLSGDWLPAWAYLAWLPLYVVLGLVTVLRCLPRYATPSHWKIEVSTGPLRFTERQL